MERDGECKEVECSSGWLRVHEWLGYINNVLLLPMFTLLILEISHGSSEVAFASVNHCLCAMFFGEWLLGLALAKARWAYLRSPEKIADLLSAIPFTALPQTLRALRLLRLLQVARLAMRLHRFRGKGTKALRAFGFTGAIVLTGALAFQIVEPQSTEGLEDALWWSLVTLSTVGYGDITPATTAGHIVAACIIVAGVGVFGYFAGFMASVLVEAEENQTLEALARVEDQLAALQQSLALAEPRVQRSGGGVADPQPRPTAGALVGSARG